MIEDVQAREVPDDGRELRTSRLIDASREALFHAFSDPEILARWWGPKGFTNSFHEFHFVPNGIWRFVMHGPDGGHYPNESLFAEIVPAERLVLRHLSAPPFELTITFDDEGGKTRVGWRQRFRTTEERERIARYAVEANEQNLDRLEATVSERPIRLMVDRETRAWDAQDAEALVDLFHPDMVWPWPPDGVSHDPATWVFPLGRYDRERWKQGWQELFDSHELVHNRRTTVRVVATPERDGGFAVVDVDTLWRRRDNGEEFHWKGRACKGYTRVGAEWKLIFHTGLLDYSMIPKP